MSPKKTNGNNESDAKTPTVRKTNNATLRFRSRTASGEGVEAKNIIPLIIRILLNCIKLIFFSCQMLSHQFKYRYTFDNQFAQKMILISVT